MTTADLSNLSTRAAQAAFDVLHADMTTSEAALAAVAAVSPILIQAGRDIAAREIGKFATLMRECDRPDTADAMQSAADIARGTYTWITPE